MPKIDELMSNINEWISESKSSKMDAVSGTKTGIAEKSIQGMPEEMITSSKAYYQYAFKAEQDLQSLMRKRKLSVGQGLDQLKKEYKIKHDTNKMDFKDYKRYTKTIDLMKKQVKIERKIGLMRKAAGKEGMGKIGKSMSKKVASSEMKGGKTGGMAGAALAAVYIAYKTILSLTHGFLKGLEKAFDRGIAGILMNVVDTITGIVGFISKDLAKVVGVFGTLLVKSYMKMMEIGISKKTVAVQMRGQMGMQPGYNLPGRDVKGMFGTTKMMKEWGPALASLGVNVTKVNSEFSRFGKTIGTQMQIIGMNMGITASQTAEFFEKALSSSRDIKTAMVDVTSSFVIAREATAKTGISTVKLAKWIGDAAVQARMMNVDFRSVSNTMSLIVKHQDDLARTGVTTRAHGAELLKGMVSVGKQWEDTQHMYFGLLSHEKRYKEETGKDLSEEKALWMSKWGYANAQASYIDNLGNLAFKPLKKGESETPSDVLSSRLMGIKKGLTRTALAEGKQAAFMYGKQIAGLPENITKMILMAKDGEIAGLANNKQVQDAFKGADEIRRNLKTIAEHQEDIQIIIASLMQKLLSVTIYGFQTMIAFLKLLASPMISLASYIPGGMESINPASLAFKYFKEMQTDFGNFKGAIKDSIKSVKKIGKYISPAADWALEDFRKKEAEKAAKRKKGKKKPISAEPPKPPKPEWRPDLEANVVPKNGLGNSNSNLNDSIQAASNNSIQNQSGNVYHINFNIPDADATIIAGKVIKHLSAQYQV